MDHFALEDILKVVLLSLLEGLSEFLPISSTGHLIVGKALLRFDAMGEVFEIFIQVGAAAAVVLYYRATLGRHALQFRGSPKIRRFWLMIALGCAPAAGFGLFFGGAILDALFSPLVVALSLIGGGVAFLLVERLPRFGSKAVDAAGDIMEISARQALIVGLAQSLALAPGVSRSGSSIIGGMLAGMDRRVATEFSFFLAIPLLGGASAYKLLTSLGRLSAGQLLMLLLGAALSAVFARLAIGWLLAFVSGHSFVAFGWYRIVAGALILLAVAAGHLS